MMQSPAVNQPDRDSDVDEIDWLDLESERRISFLSQRFSPKALIPGLVYAILAGIVSILCWRSESLRQSLAGNAGKIFEDAEWFRVVSSMLVHLDIRHFLANMFFLVPFAGLLYFYFGWRMFPLLALLLGLATQLLSLGTYSGNVNLIGSSGLLYVLFGLWLSLYYRVESQLPKSKRWLRLLGFGLIMLVPSRISPFVSYRTHYIGLLAGLVAGIIYGWIHRKEFELRNREYEGGYCDTA